MVADEGGGRVQSKYHSLQSSLVISSLAFNGFTIPSPVLVEIIRSVVSTEQIQVTVLLNG